MHDDEVLELRLPPAPAFNSTARLFVGAAGRHFALSEETLADLRVAVSEVCTEAMEARPRPDLLSIVVRARPESLEVQVEGQMDTSGFAGAGHGAGEHGAGESGGPPPSSAEAEMARALRAPLLLALFPEAVYDAATPRLVLSVPWDA